MLSKGAIERITGVLFLLLLVSIILSFTVGIDEIDTERDKFREQLLEIVDDKDRYTAGLGFDVFANFLTVPIAALLYLLFRPHHRSLALVGTLAFVAAAATFMVNDMAAFALKSQAEDFVAASGTQADSIESSARAMALAGEAASALGETFIVMALLAFGSLFILSGAVPRLLGGLTVISSALILFFWLDPLSDGFEVVAIIGFIGQLLFMLLFGGWLLLRGTEEVSAEQAQA